MDGMWSMGKLPAMEAMSPTVLVGMPKKFTARVTERMAASGAGIFERTFILFGQNFITSIVSAVSADMT